jgi:hypothetical protein
MPDPIEAAVRYRNVLLDVAHRESWPKSDALSQRIGRSPEQLAEERALGHLLGVWSDDEQTFYYPEFQFHKDGTVHPRLVELLFALSTMPSFSPSQDPGGWGRLDWLYQPRNALSELSIAELASANGIAPNETSLATEARTPAKVFPTNAEAVIALAYEDAEMLRDHRS